ncbi:MAG: ABC transporter permease [Proteobacteria bacterium]|nr:MAG: ABC transporter permease [Pseudomonadota bacterium]
MRTAVEQLGRRVYGAIEELGYITTLLGECLYWLIFGASRRQAVRLDSVFREAMQIGVQAIPIVAVLSFAVGIMLAIQGIETLKKFGAEAQVVVGIALSVTREFAPLIVGILVAGRSGSAITARIGTMHESQEIDALRVIGVNPVRYLAAPLLLAMLIMVPTLTILADFMGLLGGGVFTAAELGNSLSVYGSQTLEVLTTEDIYQGLVKSMVFAVIITLVGVANGFQVRGGAEGVGRATTRAVVLSISGIVVSDMIFTYFLNR